MISLEKTHKSLFKITLLQIGHLADSFTECRANRMPQLQFVGAFSASNAFVRAKFADISRANEGCSMQELTGTTPIFIGGSPRSGTTLLRAIVNSSATMVCGPELRVIPALCALSHQIEQGSLDVLQDHYGMNQSALHQQFAQTIHAFLKPLGESSGKRVAEKTPANILHFPHLRQLFPTSPLVSIVRDGRDVVSSLLSMDWTDSRTGAPMDITTDARLAAHQWVQSVEAGEQMANDNAHYQLRYEDLVADPHAVIGQLFDFLGEPSGAVESALRRVAGFDPSSGANEASNDRVSQPIDRRAIGRWQRDLTAKQIDDVQRVAGPTLHRYGYA